MLTRRGWFGWAWGLVETAYYRLFGAPCLPQYVSKWTWTPFDDSEALGWRGWWDLQREGAEGLCMAFATDLPWVPGSEMMPVENPENFHRYNEAEATESGWLGHWSAEGDACTALLDLEGCVVPFGSLGKIREHRRLERVRY